MREVSGVRLARVVAGLIAPTVIAGILSIGLSTAGTAQSPGEGYLWVLSIEGGSVDSAVRTGGPANDDFLSESITTNEGKIDLSFVVDPDGSVNAVGSPDGTYTQAMWHLEGTYEGKPFNCDPEIFAEDFDPAVTGTATDAGMTLQVDLPNAIEANDEMDCGGGFKAFAGSLQKLRESLTFCGDIPLPYAPSHSVSCRKWKRTSGPIDSPVPGVILRKVEHTWDLTLTRTALPASPSPSSSDTPTASPSPAQTVSPSPSTSPGPSPSPSPSPDDHDRVSFLVVRKHLRAEGAVTLLGWGAPECVDSVEVRVQKRIERAGRSVWKTSKTLVTSGIGIWSAKLKDAKGRYRALAPETVVGQATCNEAISKIKTHKH